MKKRREIEYLECDGCDYALTHRGIVDEMAARGRSLIMTLQVPWRFDGGDRGVVEFHFHAPSPDGGKHDCLRYWVTGTGIMERSLRGRDWPAEEIDAFVAQLGVRTRVTA